MDSSERARAGARRRHVPDALVLLGLLELVGELGLGALRVHLGVELRLLQLERALRVRDLRVARELHVLQRPARGARSSPCVQYTLRESESE